MAATFFGEIVEKSSRAFLDDDEDDYDDSITTDVTEESEFALSWYPEEAKSTPCETFIVISGTVAKVFADTYLLGGVTEQAAKGKDDHPSIIYKLNTDIAVCVVSSNIPDTDAVRFVEKISNLFAAASSQVLVLTSLPLSQFRSAAHLPQTTEGFLRSLCTDDPAPPALAVSNSPLEIPNLVVGVPAAVLTWCQIKKIKCRLVVCYSEQSCGIIDSLTLAPLVPLLQCPPLNQLPVPAKHTSLASKQDTTGNMFL